MKYIKISFITAIAASAVITAAYSDNNSILKNLTIRINTEGDDYAPSLTEDGNTVVFNSRMPQETSHNIFICKTRNGLWGDPYPIFAINSDSNEETPCISADGKIILFASDRPGGFSPPITSDGVKRITFDIYISRFENGKWTVPEMLKGTVNTIMNERAPGLSIDGKTLYFTRWPYNNPGKSKIYSAKLEDGGFIDVKELPEVINSGNFEIGFRQSYRSGKYYFASRKPGGLGGWDIYHTTMSAKGFTRPVNAGAERNSPYDELYYSESKTNSMLTSDRTGGLGKFDLYSSVPADKGAAVSVNKNIIKVQPTVLKITAKDKKSCALLKQNLFNVILLGDREKESVILRKVKIKSSSKGFFTLYPKDDVDSVVIEPASKIYSGCSMKIRITPGKAQDITLYLGEKTVSKKIDPDIVEEIKSPEEKKDISDSGLPPLKTIYFIPDSSDIAIEYIPELHSVVNFLRANPDSSIVISGYSDPAGSIKSNYKLSSKRAGKVADFIKSLGVTADRITVEWFGESKSQSEKQGPRYYNLDRKVELRLK